MAEIFFEDFCAILGPMIYDLYVGYVTFENI